MPAGAVGLPARRFARGSAMFAVGAALPLALQLLYVVCFPSRAARERGHDELRLRVSRRARARHGDGGSLGLVTSVPLARSDIGRETARHIVAASWISLAVVGAACGVFALAGGDVVERVLGGAYGGEVGAELGRLIVLLAPWIVASVAISLAFPLAFVTGRTRALPWIGLGALAVQVPLAWIGAELSTSTGSRSRSFSRRPRLRGAALAAMRPRRGRARLVAAAVTIGTIAVLAFLAPSLLLGSVAAAALGLVAYVACSPSCARAG